MEHEPTPAGSGGSLRRMQAPAPAQLEAALRARWAASLQSRGMALHRRLLHTSVALPVCIAYHADSDF